MATVSTTAGSRRRGTALAPCPARTRRDHRDESRRGPVHRDTHRRAGRAGIFNTLFVSVMERLREFGIMNAIGFESRRIFALVMLESMWLAVVGLAASVAVTAGPSRLSGIQGDQLQRDHRRHHEPRGRRRRPVRHVIGRHLSRERGDHRDCRGPRHCSLRSLPRLEGGSHRTHRDHSPGLRRRTCHLTENRPPSSTRSRGSMVRVRSSGTLFGG